jgi:hypothetical protein
VGRERLLIFDSRGFEEELADAELASTVSLYLEDLSVEVIRPDIQLPSTDSGEVVDTVITEALARGASLAIWRAPGTGSAGQLMILEIRGDQHQIRRIDLEEQPAATLRRTIAAMVRALVESHEIASPLSETPATEPPPSEVAPSVTEPPPVERPHPAPARFHVGATAAYGFRLPREPGPMHHSLGVSAWTRALDWLGLVIAGRLGLPAEVASSPGGEAWHGALTIGAGVDRQIRSLALGGLVGIDLEWIWGEARTGQGREARAFNHLGVGISAQIFLRIRLWRWLELLTRVETVIRPLRKVYTLHEEPAASSGRLELGFELGLGFAFM